MKRFLVYLTHEFRLARTSIAIHLVAILEIVVMYMLLTVILVHPTMDMHLTRPDSATGQALYSALQSVASPIGQPYIHTVLTGSTVADNTRQVITVESEGNTSVAVQRFNFIDSNLVKNYRNRLTAASLQLWNEELGKQAVNVTQYPTMPRDIPYNTYFGLAMLPLAVMLCSGMIGAVLTAQEFEFHIIDEYRTAPAPAWMMLAARLARLVISAAISAVLLLLAIGLINGCWPDSLWRVALILLPLAIIGGCLGIIIGLLVRNTLPAFLFMLVTSFTCWIIGSSFKPAASFGGFYEVISRYSPNSYAVNLLFPRYYGVEIGSQPVALLVLVSAAIIMPVLMMVVYHQRVLKPE